MEEHSALVYKWRLLLDFRPTNGDFFQTFGQQWALPLGGIDRYLVSGLPRQWLDLFTITSSLRKFAECLYCDVTPPPILPVLSHFIEFTCHMQLYRRTVIQVTFIHKFIQLYIHTSILSHVHTQHIHNINSYKFALVVQNIVSIVSFQFGFYLSLCQAASFNK